MTGRYDDALSLFQQMKEENVKPDIVTYNNVSSSSSSSSSRSP